MAPRISRHVLEAVFKRDDPRRPIAETYRQVAADAERLGYTRPSYEQIRTFVHRVRRIKKQPDDDGHPARYRLHPPPSRRARPALGWDRRTPAAAVTAASRSK
jgi:hypothetical protein